MATGTPPDLTAWAGMLACPLDHSPLASDGWRCPACGFMPALAEAGGRRVLDFRARETPQTVELAVRIPTAPLSRADLLASMGRAAAAQFPHYSRRDIRRRYGTKLDKAMQYYCQRVLRDCGPDAPVLDLGCGNGGTTRYLRELGFRRVLALDWSAAGAAALADAHRLPLADATFRLVVATAVFEHLYQPFLAAQEIARVLLPGGWFVGGASFWEAWHGSSFFHLTPDGWHALCLHAGLTIEDFWPGWGILPAAFSHVLTPGYLRGLGYALQAGLEGVYRLALGEQGVRKLRLRASGSYQVCARRNEAA